MSRPLSPARAGGALIVEADWVLVGEDDQLHLLRNHEVVIDGDRIAAVREYRGGRDRRLRANGQVLLPGLISAHTHAAAGTCARGLVEDDIPWFDWEDEGGTAPRERQPEKSPLRPMELMEDLTDQELEDLTVCNLVEMLRGGCTTQVEMSLSLRQMRAYIRAAERLGVRGYPAAMIPSIERVMPLWARSDDNDLRRGTPETLAEVEANLEFALSVNGVLDDRIRPMMAVTVTAAHTRETLIAVRNAVGSPGTELEFAL